MHAGRAPSGFCGRAQVFFGVCGDYLGRKRIYLVTLVIMIVATLGQALSASPIRGWGCAPGRCSQAVGVPAACEADRLAHCLWSNTVQICDSPACSILAIREHASGPEVMHVTARCRRTQCASHCLHKPRWKHARCRAGHSQVVTATGGR